MSGNTTTPARDELQRFLQELKESYYPWYDASVQRHGRWVVPIHVISLLSGFATAIIAALATDESFKGVTPVRVLLILLPAIGTGLTSVLAQGKLYERFQLRERGRFTIQSIYNEGMQRAAAAPDERACSLLHAELLKRLDEVEASQSEAIFKFYGLGEDKKKPDATKEDGS